MAEVKTIKLSTASIDDVFQMLLLVDVEVPDRSKIASLSTIERATLADWAASVHLSASDNVVRKYRLEAPHALIQWVTGKP